MAPLRVLHQSAVAFRRLSAKMALPKSKNDGGIVIPASFFRK
jgi:hypothetical protein